MAAQRAGAGSGAEPRAPAREERGRSRRRRRRAARGDPAGQARRKNQGEPGAERGPPRPPGAGRTGGGGARPATAGAAGGQRGPERRARDRADRPRPTEAGAHARRRGADRAHGPGRGPKPGGGTARLRAGPPEGRTRARTPQKPRAEPPQWGRARGRRRGARRTAGGGPGGGPTPPIDYRQETGHQEDTASPLLVLGIVLIHTRHNVGRRFAQIRPKSHRRNVGEKGVDKTVLRVVQCLLPTKQNTRHQHSLPFGLEDQFTKDGYVR